MTLNKFIEFLQKIAADTNSGDIPVQMADTIPVVEPIFKDGIVYITDERDSN